MSLISKIKDDIKNTYNNFNYLENEPHFYGLEWKENPRKIGYKTAAGVTAVASPIFGYLGNRFVDAPTDVMRHIFNIPSNTLDPFDVMVGVGTLAGVYAGAKLGTWSGKKAADLWTKYKEQRDDVRDRVKNHFLSLGHNQRRSNAETTRYMEKFYKL